jgi:hypothetical protein
VCGRPHATSRRQRPHTEPVRSIPRPAQRRAPRGADPRPARALKDRREVASLGPADKAPYRPGSARHAPGCAVIATKAVGQARAQPTPLARLDITRALCLLPAVRTRPPPPRIRAAARAPSRPPPEGAPARRPLACTTRLRASSCTYAWRHAWASGRTGAPLSDHLIGAPGRWSARWAAAPPALVPRALISPPPRRARRCA